MDAASINLMVKDIFSGDYDRAEWVAKYDSWQRVDMIAALFNDWDKADSKIKELLAGALTTYVSAYWTGFKKISELIVRQSDKEEVVKAIIPMLNKGLFCVDLLNEMKSKQRIQEDWLTVIRQRWNDKSFKEQIFDTDLEKMYHDIQILIA